MQNIIKGDVYEKYIRNYVDTFKDVFCVWLWKNIPEQVLFDNGLITDFNIHRLNRLKSKNDNENKLVDVGIDIIQHNNDDSYIFIQCKHYKNTLHVHHLAGFFMMMSYHSDKCGIVYHSTNKLSRHITDNNTNKKIKYVCKSMNSKKIVVPQKIEPYSWQKIIIKKIQKYYTKHNKGVLAMPCATGKTMISCNVAKQYKHVIFISPLKQFAQQTKKRYTEYDPDRKSLLVDSDGIRDTKTIIRFIKKNKDIMLSSTYKSCDIILKILPKLKNPLIIIDEFHNLSRNNLFSDDNPLYTIIHSDYKKLYMSATPRIYELEDDENDYKAKNILGDTIYKMDFSHAIKKKYICDYTIYLPITDTNDLDITVNEIKKELKIKKVDIELSKKCCYLYECIKRFGTMKCIIYFHSHNHIKKFTKCLNVLNKYYG